MENKRDIRGRAKGKEGHTFTPPRTIGSYTQRCKISGRDARPDGTTPGDEAIERSIATDDRPRRAKRRKRDGDVRFFHASRTVNEIPIIQQLSHHGEYLFHATEFGLSHHFMDWDGKCYFADILAVFNRNHRDYLVGIEVKDWKARVTPKLCWEYLKTYRHACEYFYIAARRFSQDVALIDELGIINLTTMRTVKTAEYLFPDKAYRASVIRRMKGCPDVRSSLSYYINEGMIKSLVEDPYQLSLKGFSEKAG